MVLEKLKEEMYRLLKERIYDSFALEYSEFTIVKNQKEGYGDFTSTVAFSLSKILRKPPMEIAGQLEMEMATIESLDIRVVAVAPGFLNIHLPQDWKLTVMKKMQRDALDDGNLIHRLRDREGDLTSVKNELEYIAYRTEWVLTVLKGEGLEPPVASENIEYIPSPVEEKLINLVVDWAEIQGEKALEEKNLLQLLQDLVEVFWKYHNSIIIRQLSQPQRSFLLGLFVVLNKITEIQYF